ncbi:hypothetical protein CN378_13590 [Bacillus sp. AFS015802]|nr:hypothetical protein CN378_13590 [Bacillus sp. AFS015802]
MNKHSKIMKSSLAVLVASSISFPSSLAFANSNEENFDTINMEQGTAASTTNVTVNDEAMLDSAKNEIEKLQESTETPSLLPGDFFYFAKVAIEKIQLAFTMDDAKEAKLLAEYAAERLAEVEALFKDGKQEEAIDALNHAIEMIQKSEDQWSQDESEKDSTAESELETDTDVKDDSQVEDESDETSSEDGADEESVKEDENSDETEEKSGDMKEMEEMMAQNIVALKANLEKVQNPKAKAALQKNIEKSYLKLAEKLSRLEENAAKKAEAKQKKDSEEPKDSEMTEQESTDVESKEQAVEETPVEQPVEETTEVKEETTVPVKAAQHTERKEAKNEWKQQHKESKQDAKIERKQEKQEAKEDRHEEKETNKQHSAPANENRQHGENEKGKENGKGHHKE